MSEEFLVDRDWAEIPYFRKPWFMVLLFLVFPPGLLLMIWSGDSYYRRKGAVYRLSEKTKIIMTVSVAILMLSLWMRPHA